MVAEIEMLFTIFTWSKHGYKFDTTIIFLEILEYNNEFRIWTYLNFVSLWFTNVWYNAHGKQRCMVQFSWKNNLGKWRYWLVFEIIYFLKFYNFFRCSLFFIFFIFNWNLVKNILTNLLWVQFTMGCLGGLAQGQHIFADHYMLSNFQGNISM